MNHTYNRLSPLFLVAGLLLTDSPPAAAGTTEEADTRLANASYQGIENAPVQLKNGRWEGEPYVEGGASRPAVGLVEDFTLRGDLDGDGVDESVVLLWQSSGGSGTFQYIAVMAEVNGSLKNVATAPVGDRVQLRSGEISDGLIHLEVVQQGAEDAACCPTQLVTRSWSLDNGRLNEDEPGATGTLSLAVLEGAEWILTLLPQNQMMPEGAVVTMTVSDGQVSGSSGCNRYSASIEYGPAPAEISVGSAMGTRMACPEELMKLESEFLGLLSAVSTFRFMAGKLVLVGDSEGDYFTLTFESE